MMILLSLKDRLTEVPSSSPRELTQSAGIAMHPSEIICVLAVVIILLNLNINRRLPPSLYLIFRNLWFKFVVNSSGHNRQGLMDKLPAVYPEFGGGFWGHGFLCSLVFCDVICLGRWLKIVGYHYFTRIQVTPPLPLSDSIDCHLQDHACIEHVHIPVPVHVRRTPVSAGYRNLKRDNHIFHCDLAIAIEISFFRSSGQR